MKFTLRPAIQSDQRIIRKLIRQVRINPMNLDWRHFVVAVSPTGELIGCGQVKTHGDGSRELASIAVLPDYRHEGVASTMIEHLVNVYPKPLYLTCRSSLESFYQRFKFQTIQESEKPPYFRRVSRLVNSLLKISRSKDRLLVMLLQP
jgi:N-acetylglutamate synthase-like GNAT family acetyltransferase